jgi:hypothetical protein
LEKQRDDPLAFAGVLDEKLAGIAQDRDAPLYLVRDVCLPQSTSSYSLSRGRVKYVEAG